MLPRVFPNQQGGAHMHVEGADDPLLRDLHTNIQHLEQVGRNTFPFIAVRRERYTLMSGLFLFSTFQ